jgi:hypothetical protein
MYAQLAASDVKDDINKECVSGVYETKGPS